MRKRGKRRARPLYDPVLMARFGAQPMDQAKVDKMRMLELTAIDTFANGEGDEPAWYQIMGMVLVCEELAKDGVGPEALPACQKAWQALEQDQKMLQSAGSAGTKETALAYTDVHEYLDLQRQSCPLVQFERALRAAASRVTGQGIRV